MLVIVVWFSFRFFCASARNAIQTPVSGLLLTATQRHERQQARQRRRQERDEAATVATAAPGGALQLYTHPSSHGVPESVIAGFPVREYKGAPGTTRCELGRAGQGRRDCCPTYLHCAAALGGLSHPP